MAKNFRSNGTSVKIEGQSADIASGSIFRRGTTSGAAGDLDHTLAHWVGVVTDDVIGTASTLTTVDGRPILIGDGLAAEAQLGDGKGDMMVEGVFTLLVWGESAVISGSMPCYVQVNDFTDPNATLIASGVTRNADFAVSGALVGFAVEDEYTGDAAPFTGRRVVDVKLLGAPLHNLLNTAP